MSLKKLDFGTHEVLQKDQLKSVFGGYGHPGPGGTACANDASPRETNWSCGDGSHSGSSNVCPEHFDAFADVILCFCDDHPNPQICN